MNVNKILERNRFTALCGGCGEIFHYSTIGEVVSAHQDGPNCETPCPSCATGVLCACEYCQSIITDELKGVTPSASRSSKVIIKDCKECELSSDSCNCVCLDLAAAPTQVVPTSTGSQRPASVSIQIDAAVYSEFVYMCELAAENGSPAGYTDPSQLIAYVLSSVADGSRRPGSWERQMLEMMGLVADCDEHYEYRSSFGNPASESEEQSK